MEQPTIFKSDLCYPGFAKRPFKSTTVMTQTNRPMPWAAQVPIQEDIFCVGQRLVALDLLPDIKWLGGVNRLTARHGSLIVLIHGDLFDHILGSSQSYFSELQCSSGLWKYLCNLNPTLNDGYNFNSCFHYIMVGFRSLSGSLYSSTHRVHDPNWLRIFLVQFFSTWSGWMCALRFKVKGCSWKVQNSKFLGRWTWNVNSFLVLNEKKSICRSQIDTDLYSGNPWSYMGIIEKDSAFWFPYVSMISGVYGIREKHEWPQNHHEAHCRSVKLLMCRITKVCETQPEWIVHGVPSHGIFLLLLVSYYLS